MIVFKARNLRLAVTNRDAEIALTQPGAQTKIFQERAEIIRLPAYSVGSYLIFLHAEIINRRKLENYVMWFCM